MSTTNQNQELPIIRSSQLSSRIRDIQFKKCETNNRGGKKVSLDVKGQPFVTVKIPLMFTWGLEERKDDTTDAIKGYDLSVVFDRNNKKSLQFMEAIQELQEYLIDTATENSQKWFGRKMSREVVEAMMYPILRYPKVKGTEERNMDGNPNMKLKLSYWQGEFSVELFDMQGKSTFRPKDPTEESHPMQLLTKASHLTGLISCSSLYFISGRWGVTWRLIQACVKPPQKLLGTGKCWSMPDSDDEEEIEKITQEQQKQNNEDLGGGGQAVEEEEETSKPMFEVSDDNNTDSEEEVVEKAPTPKKKKKVVRRKKTTKKEK